VDNLGTGLHEIPVAFAGKHTTEPIVVVVSTDLYGILSHSYSLTRFGPFSKLAPALSMADLTMQAGQAE
jgi:hypothetical protein